MRRDQMEVTFSPWHPAAIDAAADCIFAIGDVHGCAAELRALLGAIGHIESGAHRRLIFLGDLIDRGPDTIGTLRLWAEPEDACGIHAVDRLMGNHEQLLLLAIGDSTHAQKAETMWRSAAIGGEQFLDEMRTLTGMRDAAPSRSLLVAAMGERMLRLLTAMRSHVVIGNALFVHAGLDPAADPDEFLARPWSSFTEAQWAWVHDEFLTWRGGFKGRIVVHGHTPPHKHRALTGQEDPHQLCFDRLGLDGGTTRTGIVTAAQIETGRYRILRSGPAGPGRNEA